MQVFPSMCTYPHTSCLYKMVYMCVVYVSFDEPFGVYMLCHSEEYQE